eukprot:273565_1
MNDYIKLPYNEHHDLTKPHTHCNHTLFYKTEWLMVKFDGIIEGILGERIASVILEPESLRGNEHLFSFKYHCKNIKKTPNKYINCLKEGDIILFKDQIFAMQ